MTLRGGGAEGVTLIIPHLDFWKMVWMWRTGWLEKLVQGTWIHSKCIPPDHLYSITDAAMFLCALLAMS